MQVLIQCGRVQAKLFQRRTMRGDRRDNLGLRRRDQTRRSERAAVSQDALEPLLELGAIKGAAFSRDHQQCWPLAFSYAKPRYRAASSL